MWCQCGVRGLGTRALSGTSVAHTVRTANPMQPYPSEDSTSCTTQQLDDTSPVKMEARVGPQLLPGLLAQLHAVDMVTYLYCVSDGLRLATER